MTRKHFEVVDFVKNIPDMDIALIHENQIKHLLGLAETLNLEVCNEELQMLLQVVEDRKKALKRLKDAIDGCPEGVEELAKALQNARHIEFRTGAQFPGGVVEDAAKLHE